VSKKAVEMAIDDDNVWRKLFAAQGWRASVVWPASLLESQAAVVIDSLQQIKWHTPPDAAGESIPLTGHTKGRTWRLTYALRHIAYTNIGVAVQQTKGRAVYTCEAEATAFERCLATIGTGEATIRLTPCRTPNAATRTVSVSKSVDLVGDAQELVTCRFRLSLHGQGQSRIRNLRFEAEQPHQGYTPANKAIWLLDQHALLVEHCEVGEGIGVLGGMDGSSSDSSEEEGEEEEEEGAARRPSLVVYGSRLAGLTVRKGRLRACHNAFGGSLLSSSSCEALQDSHVTFDRNVVWSDHRSGLALLGNSNAAVTGNEFTHCAEMGIAVQDDASATLEANLCKSSQCGVHIIGAARVELKANTLCNNRLSGLAVGASARVRGIATRAHENGEAGITVGQEAHAWLDDTHASLNTLSGIIAQGQARLNLHRSRCDRNGQSGIIARDSAQVAASSSVCCENGLLGMALQGKTVTTIKHFEAQKNEHAGLGVYEEAAAALWGEVFLQENWRKLTQEEKKAGGTKEIAVQATARLTPPLMDGSVPGFDVKNDHMKDRLLGGAAAVAALAADVQLVGPQPSQLVRVTPL